ncbi:MAG TPA: methionine gamma-lyase family protein [Clostridiales bacterium]|nr:methionine gamma-lyase family protein [Clostridiales bacterium]HPV01994.1 methionine gamma-lyase family protein [Clostridiales bacterium]
MDIIYQDFLKNTFGIDESIIRLTRDVEHEIREIFREIESIREVNQYKVIAAMQEHNLSDSHFGGTTGYGYNDRGREVLDGVYASVFGAEDALVRHQIVSGTQAIAICLYGNLRPGDELLSITGKPYDTLEEVIGIRGEGAGSLKDFGITYRQLDLLDDGGIDIDNIKTVMGPRTKMVLIQRSRGYEWRPSIKIEDIRKAVRAVKQVNSKAIVMVDNCYGEFTETEEPTQAGADLVAGSLIKNPGGGLVPAGGYIAGKSELVQNAAYRLTTPGLGKEVGATLGNNRLMFQGLFMAPHVVAESIKGAVFTAALMQKLGFETSPGPKEKRSDIIQAIRFNDPEKLTAFCQGIQKGSPVDSFVTPEPWDMPGYDSKVIMAAGAFVQGSSIELSADAPLKPPYTAYMQGGLVYEHVKLGVMTALKYMKERNLARF